MSINITKHCSPIKSRRNTAILLDPERTKKETFEERRKQRLLQVRSQSKELASKVRRNVNLENKKQLKRIAQTKEQEMKNSTRKQHNDDNEILYSKFGEAHQAANLENKLNIASINRPACPSILETNYQTNNSKINKKINKNTDKENSSYNANIQQYDHFYPNVIIGNKNPKKVQPAEESNSSTSSTKSKNSQQKDKQSLKKPQQMKGECCFLPVCCCCQPILTCQCRLNSNCYCSKKEYSKSASDSEEVHEKSQSAKPSYTTKFSNDANPTKPISSYASFKEKQQQRRQQNTRKLINTTKLTKTPSVIMEVSSGDSDSSLTSCIIEDTHSNTNMHFSRVYSRTGNKNHKTPTKYYAKDFQASTDPSSESLEAPVPLKSTKTIHKSHYQVKCLKPVSPELQNRGPTRARFTKISDLLKQKSIERNISNDLPINFDRGTQMSPNTILHGITAESIAKDFCTRGILVDSNELAQNQIDNQRNINKNITENQNSLRNYKDKEQEVQKKNSVIIKEKEKSPCKVVKNVNIGPKKRNSTPQIGELLGPKSILSSKTTISTKENSTDKVQYYDYNNRFQKQYQAKSNNLIQNDQRCNIAQLNAMENANIERQLQKSKDNEMQLLRKKSEDRCQEAIEREQVRRDYEALQAKLDALTMDKKNGRNISQPQDDIIMQNM